MRDYAKICPEFWTGQTARLLRGNYKVHLAAGYLFSSPHANMIGLYYLPLATFSHETGIPINEILGVLHHLMNLDFCEYDKKAELVWAVEAAKYQVAESLDPSDKRVKGIWRYLQHYKYSELSHRFYLRYKTAFHLGETSPFQGPSKPLRSQEQEQEQEQEPKQEQEQEGEKKKPSPSAVVNGSVVHEAEEVLMFLNEKTGHQFRFRENGKGKLSANAEMIMARLKSGVTVEDCKSIIAKQAREWKHDPKTAKWLRPSTLFSRQNFEQYLGVLRK